jgi:nucleoside-diphosphate-sugar epimerase
MGERILITGGAGFIGSHLAASHCAAGDEVHILVRPGGPLRRLHLSLGGVTVHRARLDHAASVAECLVKAQPTILYHLAGGTGRDPALPSPGEVKPMLQDVVNLLTLLAAAAEMRSPPHIVIRAGSLAEYGNGAMPSKEDQREDPLTVYTAAMVAGLHYARMLQPRLPFPVVTARFALVYGPGQSDDYFLPWLMRRCLVGQPSTIARPRCRRDMIFVEDVVEGLRRMAVADLAGGTVLNLSTGQAPTVREIAALVATACRADPGLLLFTDEDRPNFRVETLHGSPARARELLQWEARTSFAEGLQLCVASASERLTA